MIVDVDMQTVRATYVATVILLMKMGLAVSLRKKKASGKGI